MEHLQNTLRIANTQRVFAEASFRRGSLAEMLLYFINKVEKRTPKVYVLSIIYIVIFVSFINNTLYTYSMQCLNYIIRYYTRRNKT